MTPARRSRILLSFGTAFAFFALCLAPIRRANAVDAERRTGVVNLLESTQALASRLQTHDQTELLIALDELNANANADADRNSRAVADLLRAGQPDVVADHALDALARMKSRESRAVLITFCRHRRADARARAYTALGNLRDSRDFPTITEGLRDSSAQVRAQVAVMLGKLQVVQAVPDLLRALPLGVHQAAAAIGKLGDTASIESYSKQLGKLPLPVMLEGYGQYLDRADIPESAKLQIVAALEEVSGATVKAFLNARVQNPSKNTTPKIQQVISTSAGRIVAEPSSAAPAKQQVQP